MISRDEIKHIYALAKLDLRDEDVDEIRTKFSEVLEYVSKILEVETPEEHLELLAKGPCILREDIPEESLSREAALAHAFETEYGYFRLDRVVE